MKVRSGLRRFIAVFLSFAMVFSTFAELLPGGLVHAADETSEMHVIVKHWHVGGDTTGDIDAYFVNDGGKYSISGEDKSGGVATFNAVPDDSKETFAGFAVSAGNDCVALNSTAGTFTVTYSSDVHLVKVHVFYSEKPKLVPGTQMTAGAAEGADIGEYEDTKSQLWDTIDSGLKSKIEAAISNDRLNELMTVDDLDNKYIKLYNTSEGLHTDKTATPVYYDPTSKEKEAGTTAEDVNEEGKGTRVFDINLEAWYNDQATAKVGLILDASGSMAFISEGLEPMQLSVEGEQHELPDGTKVNINEYLTPEQVNKILDTKLTDSSKLSYSDYSYYIFDTRDFTQEFVPLAYWGGNNGEEPEYLVPQYSSEEKENHLLGFWDFNETSNTEIINRVTNKPATVYIKDEYGHYTVKNGSATDSDYFKNGGHYNHDYSSGRTFALSDFSRNKKGDKTKPQALVFDVKPTSNTFTVSFIVGEKTQDKINPERILFIGDRSQDVFTLTSDSKDYNATFGYNFYDIGQGYYKHIRFGSYNKNKASRIDSVFETKLGNDNNDSIYSFVTMVFSENKDGSVDYKLYKNGDLAKNNTTKNSEGTIDSANTLSSILSSETFDLVLGGDSDYDKNHNIYIDDLFLFDVALSADEVKKLYGNVKAIDENGYEAMASAASVKALDDNNNVIGIYKPSNLSEGTQEIRAGWYFVNSGSDLTNFYETVGTAKELCGLPAGEVIKNEIVIEKLPQSVQDYFVKNPEDVTNGNGGYIATSGKTFTGDGYIWDGDGKASATKITVKEGDKVYYPAITVPDGNRQYINGYSPCVFFIDSAGYLRCFYNNGGSTHSTDSKGNDEFTDELRSGVSYVYEKKDDQNIKTEDLQYALGQFAAQLHNATPNSMISAVRFSNQKIGTGYANGKPAIGGEKTYDDNELKKLVLLDWTSDTKEISQILSLTRGEGENYGGTLDSVTSGSTTGKDGLVEGLEGMKQYNYGMTGGTYTWVGFQAYTDFLDSRIDDNDKAKKYIILFTDGMDNTLEKDSDDARNYAISLANTLKEEKGYTIFYVVLRNKTFETGGRAKKVQDYMAEIAGNKSTPSDKHSYTDLKDQYIFEAENVDELTSTFTGEILRQVSSNLLGYTVRDYIDPRFDLVDSMGNTIVLGKGGKVTINDKDGTEVESETLDNLKEKGVIHINDGYTATLKYDTVKERYYLEWADQDIPGTTPGQNSLTIWSRTFRVKAKEDFIGGNAVLSNGNGANENWVFYPDDEDENSGTSDAVVDKTAANKDDDGNLIDTYVSKGFQRTTVNVRLLTPLVNEANDEIYMGETIDPNVVANDIIKTVQSNYYWEYLGRYYSRVLKKDPNYEEAFNKAIEDLLNKDNIVENEKFKVSDYAGLEDYLTEKGIKPDEINTAHKLVVPYMYLPNKAGDDYTNTVGDEKYQGDQMGTITYMIIQNTPNDELSGSVTTKDTEPRSYIIWVQFTADQIEDDTTVDTDNLRETAVKSLVNEKTKENEDVYPWDKNYKPAAGVEQIEKHTEGPYNVDIVAGEIILEWELDANTLDYLNKHFSGNTIKYSADLMRSYEVLYDEVSAEPTKTEEKVGTFNVTIDCGADNTETTRKVTFTPNPDNEYNEIIPKYGLPIGKYTLANENTSFEGELSGLLEKCFKGFTAATAVDIAKYYDGFTGYSEIKTASATYDNNVKADLAAEYSSNEIYLGWNGSAKTTDYLKDRLGVFLIRGSIDTGSVTITKKVEDSTNTADEVYAITLTQSGSEPEGINDSYPATGTLIDENGDSITDDKVVNFVNGEATVYLKGTNSITISDLPAGIGFTIAEDTGNLDYTYEKTILPKTVTISKETPVYVTVTNTVKTGSLTITKNVTGEGCDKDKEFNFVVKLYKPNSKDVELTGSYDYTGTGTVKDGTDKKISSGDTFTLAHGQSITISGLPVGTTYTVTETDADKDGYVIKDSENNVIKDAEGNAVYSFTGEISETTAEEVFINYKPAPVDWTVSVEKQIDDKGKTGRDENWTTDDKYDFTIKLTSENADYVEYNDEKFDGEKTVTLDKSSKKDGKVRTGDFGKITFTKAGEYTFTISETEGNIAGIAYDKTVYTVTAKVEDKGGKLEVTETIKKLVEGEEPATVDSIIFTNTYDPDAAPVDIPITKEFIGGTITEDFEDFELKFTLEDTDEASGAKPVVVTMTKKEYLDEVEKSFDFSIDTAGTHTYTVTEEVTKGGDYYTNDSTVYTVTVKIGDDGGKLTLKSLTYEPDNEKADGIVFTNTVKTGSLTITKTVTGDGCDTTKAFNFEVELYKPNSDKVALAGSYDYTGKNGASNGKITNGTGTFTLAHGQSITISGLPVGTTYTVTETDADKDGYVTSSAGDTDTIVANVESTAAFTNDYQPAPVDWTVSVEKQIDDKGKTGRDEKWTTDDKYVFTITTTATDGVTFDGEKAVTLDMYSPTKEDVKVRTGEFGKITFTKAGEYKFKVSETKGSIAGIAYDNTVYTVTVTVTDAGGQLTAKVAYSDNKGNADLEGITFTNTYTPAKTSPVSVSATKELTENGKPVKVEAGKFSFTVTPDSDNPENDPVKGETVTNEAGGAIKLITDAVYTAAGEYKYTVAEEGGSDIAHYTYDDTVYTVTVTVTDVGGQLTAKVAYSDNKGNANLSDITFTNTYTPDPVPDVKIEKTQFVGPNATAETATTEDLTVKPGDTVTYFLTVANTVEGSVATDVTVTDDIPNIPEELVFVEGSISDNGKAIGSTIKGTNNGGTITWTIDKLEFNKPAVLSFSVKVPDEAKKASWSNFATVKYPNPDDPDNPNTDDSNHVTINEPAPKVNPKVTVVKTQAVGADATVGNSTDKDLTVKPGDTVTYFLTVSASGGSEGSVAEGIKVTDKIPEGLKLVEGSITNGGVNNGGIITWTVDVANGDSVVLSFKVTVPEVGEEPVSNTTRSWKNAAQFNGTDTNTVTVTENLGNLRITKRVSGNDGDRTEAFRFTLGISNVAISDTAVFTITDSDNKPVGSAEFVNGVCEFTLAHGQSLTVSGLPVGAHFEVKEIDSGYDTTATVTGNSGTVSTGTDGVIASGTIAKDSTVTASFNNYRHKTVQTGSLTVRKTVASPNLDPDAVYTFRYTFTLPQYSEEPTLTYRITDIYGESGGNGRLRPDSITPDAAGRLIVTGTFTLKHNQKIVISGIPVDTDYEVREDVPAGYILSTYKDTGTVSAVERNHTAVFVNTEYIPGSLTVSKTAIGSEADPYSFFDFVVVLYNDAQMTEIATDISGMFGNMTFENGVAKLTFSDGESCTATGLPGNLYYTVVETDNGEGYTPELAVPVGQTPLLTFNTPNVFDDPPAPDGTVVPDEPVADEPVADEPVADEPVAEPVVTGEPAVIDEPVTSDEPMPADEMSGEPVASEPDIIPDGTTTADEPVLPDETASDGNNIPFDLPMPIDEPAYGPTVSGAITPNATGTASFVNVKNVDVDVRAGELVIEKQVTGHGDREYGFGFSVEFYTDATFLTDVTADNYADIYAVVIKDTPGAETEGEEFVEISAGIGTFTLKDGESVCIGGIPDGTYFRVTEYDADGHTVSVTGDCMTIDEYSVYGTVSGDDSAHVIFNNNLPENHAVPVDATLKIAKSFSAPGATSRGDLTFNFTITEEPEGTSAPKTDRVTVYSGEDNPEETGTSHGITLSFPEAGTYTYSVNEEPISDDAGKYEGITTVGEPVEVVINVAANDDGTLYIASATVDGESVADTKLITVSFVNPYEPPATEPDEPEPATVELKITKSFSTPGATSRGDLTFNFTITEESEESSTPVSVTVKKDAETGTSDDAVKLSFDAAGEYTYYVSEEPLSDDVGEYDGTINIVEKPVKVVITVDTRDDGTLYIASATVDGEPVADTKLITVSFVNTYEPPTTEPDEPEPATGSLTLSKVLYINNRIVRGVGQFRFRIELDSDFTGGRFSNGVAEVVLAAGESITLEGLPAGARYTVSEYNTYGYTLLVRESTGLSGTIPEDGEAKAAAVNVRVDTWQPSAPPIGGPVGGEPPAETPEVEPPTEAGQTDEDGAEGPAPSAGFLSGAAAALMMGAAAIALKLKRR